MQQKAVNLKIKDGKDILIAGSLTALKNENVQIGGVVYHYELNLIN